MIKKKIFSLAVLGLLSFGTYTNATRYFHDVNEEYSVSNATEFTQKILSSSAGVLEGAGMQPKALIMTQGRLNATAGQKYRVIYYRDKNNELNFIRNVSYNNNSGFYNIGHYHIDTFYRFSGTGFEDNTSILNISRNGEAINVDSFYTNSQLKGAMTRTAYFIVSSSTNYQSAICFIYDNLDFSICAIGNPTYGCTETTKPSGADIDPVNFDIDIIGTSPRTSNTPTPTPRPNTPNTNIYCPTIGQLLKNYGENYNTGLCYNNTLYFNNETLQFETVEQEDIFTIFTNYTTFTNRQSIYNTNCGTPYTANSCSNAFSGEYKKYSILSNMINAKVDEKKLWNYCNMALNYDLNATTCVASGVIAEPPTRDEFLDSIINGDYTVVTPNSGNIYDNLLTGDQTRETETQRDVFGAMDRIYTKITGLFKDRKGVQGIIPEYIMRICYISILFIVLFKKG